MEIVNLLDNKIVIFEGTCLGDAKLIAEHTLHFHQIILNKHAVQNTKQK